MMSRMVRCTALFGASALALTIATPPAQATTDMGCGGEGAYVDLEVGAGIASIWELKAAGRTWSSSPGFRVPANAEPIHVGEEFNDGEETQVDFVTERGGEVIATLYWRHAREGKLGVWAGLISVKGVGAWLVTCDS